tara:strand:+ start:2757 stop:3647 length:891 start_codon:yes stop_codon:yes gene_type:complete
LSSTQSTAGAQLLAWRRRQLKRGGRSVDLDWLLDFGGGLAWTDLQRLLIDPDRRVTLTATFSELERFWMLHLEHHKPLQHLVGLCPWRDLLIEVSPSALIPRQETEQLVDLALSIQWASPVQRWADLGTGSGAIAIALAHAFPQAHGHAVDRSEEALALAKQNLVRLVSSNHCQLHLGSWWEPLKPWWGEFDLVLSNPPYIPESLIAGLDPVVSNHEPHLALDGGADGLDSIRRVVARAGHALAPGGWLLLEHHHDQSDAVLDWLRGVGLVQVEAVRDLQGIVRFAMARRPLEQDI